LFKNNLYLTAGGRPRSSFGTEFRGKLLISVKTVYKIIRLETIIYIILT